MNLRKTNKQPKPTDNLVIPPGSFIKTEAGLFYVHTPGKRKKFISSRVLDSWSPPRVLELSEKHKNVASLVLVGKMLFRDGSLLYHSATGSIYLVSGFKLRLIDNPDYLSLLGVKQHDAVWVSSQEIQLHEMGENLE